MEIQKKYDILTDYLRGSGKALGAGAFFTSLIALVVFVLGAYYGLFRYYETVVKGYYDSILQGVASYQSSLVKKGTYKIDLKKVALSMIERRGVLSVWCTDRYGRLIFHTDEGVLRDYESKRLPSDYYESVTHRWTFTSGLPDVFSVALPGRLHRRLSIPLYAFGTDDFDFVLGMDVKKFVFLPSSPKRLLVYTAGSILLAFLLLFFPLLVFIRGRFAGILSQARYMVGAIQLEARKEAAVSAPQEEPVSYESELRIEGTPIEKAMSDEAEGGPVKVEPRQVEEKAREEIQAEIKEAAKEDEGEKEKRVAVEKGERGEEAWANVLETMKEFPEMPIPPAKAKKAKSTSKAAAKGAPSAAVKEAARTAAPAGNAIDEKMMMIPLLMLMETKQAVYKKQDVSLPFLEAAGAVFHSRGAPGSYLHYCEANEKRCYTLFSYPETSPEEATSHLSGIAKLLESDIAGAGTSGDVMKSFNSFCLQNKIEIQASLLLIFETDKKVEYCSAGEGQAIYLKHGESELKSLRMDVPGLGSLSKSEFGRKTSYAEITFVANDLFLLMPFNGASVFLGEESFEDMVKRLTLTHRNESARDIVDEVRSSFEPFKRKDKGLPETGFAVVKFL
jgi:hypothetical protein